MKKNSLVISIFLSIIILGGGGFYLYSKYDTHGLKDPFSVVPKDAVFTMETKNLTKAWQAISDSKIWKHLLNNQYFNSINEDAASMDELLKKNQAIDMLLRDRRMMISAHLISSKDYDFIFVVDLGNQQKLSFLTTFLNYIHGYKLQKKVFDDIPVFVLENSSNQNKIYLSMIENLLVVTFKEKLIVKSIQQRKLHLWELNPNFKLVMTDVRDNKLFNLYLNYKVFDKYLNIYLQDESELGKSLSDALAFSGLQINLENEQLIFDGYTSTDSLPSYIKALQDVEPGKIGAFNVIPENSALYLSLAFDNYFDFYNQLINQFSSKNEKNFEGYEAKVKKAEKFLNVNLGNDFFNWIGNEIAFVKLQPSQAARPEDVIVCFNASKIEVAKAGLTHITEQIRKRTPVKFDVIQYKNFEINFLSIKGFFQMFFGKLFGKLEKPYFTYIDNYVVFSNSMDALKQVIDSYTEGKTLSKNQKYLDFTKNFDPKTNISAYVQMPKLYSNLYLFSTSEKQESIRKNKELILSFSQIGLQMTSDAKRFKTKIVAIHQEMDQFSDEMALIEQEAKDDLMNKEIDSLAFKLKLEDKDVIKDGLFKIFYEAKILKAEGSVKHKQVDGLCKSYFESGKIKNSIFYAEGKANGVAEFFYDQDKSTKRVEAMFENDKLIGAYREFYDNGKRKALLNYENGKLNGTAEYYYKSGNIKLEGEFKEGLKTGKWVIYDDNGEILDKEKWKKGNLRT